MNDHIKVCSINTDLTVIYETHETSEARIWFVNRVNLLEPRVKLNFTGQTCSTSNLQSLLQKH